LFLLFKYWLKKEVKIPIESTIATAKACLVEHANTHLLSYSDPPAVVSKSWVVLAMFGHDDMYDFPLEIEAIEPSVQLELMRSMFNLTVIQDGPKQLVRWNEKCRFALVIFSVTKKNKDGSIKEEPWSFVHEGMCSMRAPIMFCCVLESRNANTTFIFFQRGLELQPRCSRIIS
jgi:hypothetical protein